MTPAPPPAHTLLARHRRWEVAAALAAAALPIVPLLREAPARVGRLLEMDADELAAVTTSPGCSPARWSQSRPRMEWQPEALARRPRRNRQRGPTPLLGSTDSCALPTRYPAAAGRSPGPRSSH